MEAFSAEWEVDTLPETFSLEDRNKEYPNLLLGSGAIVTGFSDGSFISTMGGRDYSGHFIYCTPLSKTHPNLIGEPYIRKIVDTDRDYLPDRIVFSNDDRFIGRFVVTKDGFNLEFKKDNNPVE